MLDFQKLDPFWNLWSKPNPEITFKSFVPNSIFSQFGKKDWSWNFLWKQKKTEYLSNQLTYAHFDRKFIFHKIWDFCANFHFFGFPKCFKFLRQLLLSSSWKKIETEIFFFICFLYYSNMYSIIKHTIKIHTSKTYNV